MDFPFSINKTKEWYSGTTIYNLYIDNYLYYPDILFSTNPAGSESCHQDQNVSLLFTWIDIVNTDSEEIVATHCKSLERTPDTVSYKAAAASVYIQFQCGPNGRIHERSNTIPIPT